MSRPNHLIYFLLTVYFTAMVMLIAYLIYARFSPAHRAMYAPPHLPNQTVLPGDPTYCDVSTDCFVDSCMGCQVVNKDHLSAPNICLVDCPIEAICLNHQCLGVPTK